jgi:hypothetical protein
MVKKRKKRRTKKETEPQKYEIEINDWEGDYHFGLSQMPKDLHDGLFWERSSLILSGSILSPVVEKASGARVELSAMPEMEDHWTREPTIPSAKAIGWMEIPRGEDTLIFHCSIPSRLLQNITLAAHAGRLRFVSMFGTKLKYRQGTISSVTLSRSRDEEEEEE